MFRLFPLLCLITTVCSVSSPSYGHNGYHAELQHVDELIAAMPGDATLWMQRGHLDVLHGDWQAAMIDLEKADRLAPGKLLTGYVRGQALALGGQFEAGKAVLDDVIAAHGNHPDPYVARARIFLKLNKPAEAAKDLACAIEKSAHPEPDLFVEAADAMTVGGQKDEALKVLQAGMDRLGNIPQLALKAIDMELAARRFDAALDRVAIIQKGAPRPEPWMARRAEVLAQAGRAQESTAAWTALRDRIAALPAVERGSSAMSQFAVQAEQAIATLSVSTAQSATVSTSPPLR